MRNLKLILLLRVYLMETEPYTNKFTHKDVLSVFRIVKIAQVLKINYNINTVDFSVVRKNLIIQGRNG